MSRIFILAAALHCFTVVLNIQALYYNDREGQPHFDPEAHGLSQSEPNEDMSWSEIFADELKDMMNRERTLKPSFMNEDNEIFHGHFEADPNWPTDGFPVGQVGGLATDEKGQLHVFHRANRVWGPSSFNGANIYQDHNRSLISEPTMLIVNISDGSILGQWGKDLFVLPHGLEVDSRGNVFATDVALHQVFMFKSGEKNPSLVLGKAFEPAKSNDDNDLFCEPTDVAVATNGHFYVSDGYCVSRIMMFSKEGNLVQKFGLDDSTIPHGLALAEDIDLICVADREGMRILCYKAGLEDPKSVGTRVAEFTNNDFGRVFGITYSPLDGLLYGILGKTGVLKSQGFSIDLRDNSAYKSDLVAYWSPEDEDFQSPHAIALSKDGGSIFVGEIGPNYIWKFEKDF